MWPDRAEVCRRIRVVAERPRIILTIRNQVDWFGSQYRYMLLHLPKERSRFIDFMTTLEGKMAAYTGMHDVAIEEYHRQFGRENVLVLPLEKTVANLEATLRETCRFLGISCIPYEGGEKHRNAAAVYAEGELPFQQAGIDDGRRRSSQGMTEEDEIYLRSFFAASNARLSVLLGEDLSVYGYVY